MRKGEILSYSRSPAYTVEVYLPRLRCAASVTARPGAKSDIPVCVKGEDPVRSCRRSLFHWSRSYSNSAFIHFGSLLISLRFLLSVDIRSLGISSPTW
ncbi:hypothetical protein Tco_0905942 [Tanacetum coccineum]